MQRGSRLPRPRAGSRRSRGCPSPRSSELRATVTPENPIGAHLCATPSEIVRIYSTSGTTGAPSYIPLTAGDLDNWVTGSSRSYAASGISRRSAHRHHLQRGTVRSRCGPSRIRPHRRLSHTSRHRKHRAADAGDGAALSPEAAVFTPSYAAYLIEWAAERNFDLQGSSIERVLVAGEPGGGEPAFRAKLEDGWGAKVTEAMGIGDIGVSLWGECEEQDGMHLGARGFVHAEMIDPETEVALELEDGVTGELVLTHLQHRAAPLLRFRTRDHVLVRTSPCAVRSHRPTRAVHRADRRHAHHPRGQRLPVGGPGSRERVRSRGQRPHPR